MQPEECIVPVLLAGGEGKRLRPLTSLSQPKPFLKPFSHLSLLQQTLQRGEGFANPLIICDHLYAARAEAEAKAINFKNTRIIAEPCGRSTAAAIMCAALLLEKTPDMVMLVMPCDHYIADSKALRRTILNAHEVAQGGNMVLLGVKPRSASTRYGYIQVGAQTADGLPVRQFIEKPDARTAANLLQQNVYWNTGMFMCRVDVFVQSMAQYAPDIYNACRAAMLAHTQSGSGIFKPCPIAYRRIPARAIDYALMEKLSAAMLQPLHTDWHDIGCWPSLLRVKFAYLRSRSYALRS
jgi:mannose-1-phosphate guanylyltransferase/mannose-6-phosphate isomerase